MEAKTMIMENLNTMVNGFSEYAPKIIGAFLIFVIGMFIASFIRKASGTLLGRASANRRFASVAGSNMDVEGGISKLVYLFCLLMVGVAVVNVLDLPMLSGPLQAILTPVLSFLPNLIGGVLLIVVAWVVATLVRTVITKGLGSTTLDERLDSPGSRPISSVLATVGYWGVFILFMPAILGTLKLNGLLGPVQGMVQDFLTAIPNIFKAVVIGVVGYFIAKLLKDVVSSVLNAAGADAFGSRIGMKDTQNLSNIGGSVVQVVVLVFAMLQAFTELKMDAITAPITSMLQTIVGAIPNVIAAAVIIGITVFIGRLIVPIVENLLEAVGLNKLPSLLGIKNASFVPTRIVGKLIFGFMVLFATVEGANRLGFNQVSSTVNMFIQFGGNILLGAVILVVGFMLARMAKDGIVKIGGTDATFMAQLAQVAITGLVLAMGLGAMGIAEGIVNMAFGFSIGAVAIAFALSFGLGGREAAGKVAEKFLKRFM